MDTVIKDEPMSIYTEDFKIHTYEVDMHNRLTVQALCQFLQEAASSHANSLGFGVEFFLKNRRTWVLSRLGVDMKEPVPLGSSVTIKTWPSGVKKLFFIRDFIIENGEGREIGSASSYWIFLDTENMRPIPPSKNEITFNYDDLPVSSDRLLNKIPSIENPSFAGSFNVRYSDLDLNNHVNNITYIQWAMEGIEPQYKRNHWITSLNVTFLSEVKYGQQIQLEREKSDDFTFLHSMKVQERDVCRIKTRWADLPR